MSDFMEQVEPLVSEMRKMVLGELGQRLSSLVEEPWSQLAQEISELGGALEKVNSWRIQDQQGAIYLKISCALLAAYRTLERHIENKEKLLDTLRAIITAAYIGQNMDTFLSEHFGISPDAPDEAWDRLCENYISKARERFGSAWVYEQGIKDQKRFFVNIRKCGFADFLLAEGARDLLYMLCAMDYTWADGLEKYRIRFERPTTLSEGSDACRFQFFKVG
jgi:hypothetical protein